MILDLYGVKFVLRDRNPQDFWMAVLGQEPKFPIQASGKAFLDIGANVGGYSLPAAKVAKFVLAIEPDPELADLLKESIRSNGYTNMAVLRDAVCDRVGQARFHKNEVNVEKMVTVSGKLDDTGTITVPTTTIDLLDDTHGPFDIIKMDIEGGEYDALQGSTNALNRVPEWYVEVHTPLMETPCHCLICSIFLRNGYIITSKEGSGVHYTEARK